MSGVVSLLVDRAQHAQNWDSYGAEPTTAAALDRVPAVVGWLESLGYTIDLGESYPMNTGGYQVDGVRGDEIVSVIVDPAGDVVEVACLHTDLDDECEWVFEFDAAALGHLTAVSADEGPVMGPGSAS